MKHSIKLLFLSLFISTPLMASGGHAHEADGGHSQLHGLVSSEEVITKASEKVNQLAEAGRIDVSWSGIKTTHSEQKSYAAGTEWVIVFKNAKLKEPTKQTLYLFFSLDGHYIAANYSGK